jgi:hypothetical protein
MTNEAIVKLQDALSEVRERYHFLILEDIKKSGCTYREIAAKFGCSEGLVYTISRMNGISRNGHNDGDAMQEAHNG